MSNQDITQTTNEMVFNFKGNELTTITDENGDPWFVARQVADLLGYKNLSRDIHRHCKSLKMLKSTDTVSLNVPSRGLVIIPERDVYRLVMRSNMPEAEEFEEWVVSEVLPSIRKTGSYQVPLTREQQIAQALVAATEVMEEQKQTIEYQSKKIEEDAPKVGFYDDVGDATNLLTMGNAIKNMNIPSDNGGYLGRNKAFAVLRGMKILQSSNTYWNQPYQQYINQGYFVVKGMTLPNGIYKTTTYVTGKGFRWIHKKLTE